MHFVTLRVTATCCIGLDRDLGGSELAHEDFGPNAIFSGAAPASSRASSLPRKLVCNAERGACCGHLSLLTLHVGMQFVTLRVTATCCIGLDRNLGGSELAHEGVGPNAIFSGAAPASSRASSLPRKLVCNAERGACCGHSSFLTLRVGMQFVTLCVTATCCIGLDRNHGGSELAHEDFGPNAIFSGAAPASSRASSLPRRLVCNDERGACCGHSSFLTLRVGMQFVTLCVTATCCIGLDRNLGGSELAHEDFGPNAIFSGAAPASSRASSLPRRLVCNDERGACCGHSSFLTLRVGMQFVTLCVTATCCIGLDRNLGGSELAHEDFGPNAIFSGAAPASSRASSLPRKLVCNAERGACCGHLSFLTLRVGMHFVTLRVTATCCIGLDRNLGGSELAHEDFGPNAIFSGAAPASSRASSLPRRLCITLSAAHRHDGVLRDTSRSARFSVAMHFGEALRHMALIAIRHARE
ncbi:hypothetical protein SAMN05421724_4440 [Pseudomonas syringae]|nr:hypothetical protein SAMN05421724_4440 [Pseudomonas syringae]